jgi:hypothetical protein
MTAQIAIVMMSINLCRLVRVGSRVWHLCKVVSDGDFGLKLHPAWSSVLFSFAEKLLLQDTTLLGCIELDAFALGLRESKEAIASPGLQILIIVLSGNNT